MDTSYDLDIANLPANASTIDVLRKVGLTPTLVYRALQDALKATKTICTDSGVMMQVVDHDTRLKAADKLLKVMGHLNPGADREGQDAQRSTHVTNIVNLIKGDSRAIDQALDAVAGNIKRLSDKNIKVP